MILEKVVAAQLARSRVQPFQVARRCPAGYPMVIECDPLPTPSEGRDPGRVFTTLYWLTCPELIRHVGGHESTGAIGRMENWVAQNPAARQALEAQHLRYSEERRRRIGAARLRALADDHPKLAASLAQTGIGGVSGGTHLKCLHAHAAYHLVQEDHPVFLTHPELLTDISECRRCDRLVAEGAAHGG